MCMTHFESRFTHPLYNGPVTVVQAVTDAGLVPLRAALPPPPAGSQAPPCGDLTATARPALYHLGL